MKNDLPARRSGKSHAIALKVAAELREGKSACLAYTDPETGKLRFDPIVTVPGMPDGTQLEQEQKG